MHPEVSIVIAAYNAGRTIRQAIDSALSQTFTSIEVIVCDDASIDDTAGIVESYDDRRVQLIRNSENLGPGQSRDKAVANSHGRWIAFMDADDAMNVRRIELLMNVCLRNPNGIIFDDIEECHDTKSGMIPFRRVHGANAFSELDDETRVRPVSLLDLLSSKRLLVKAMIPVSQIRSTGVRHLSLRYGEDGAFLWTLVARGTKVFYVPIALYQYRVTPGSASVNPQKYLLLAQCYESLLCENLQSSERDFILERCEFLRDLAKFKSWRQLSGIQRMKVILIYFGKDPMRILSVVKSRIGHLKYNLSRLRAGGRGR